MTTPPIRSFGKLRSRYPRYSSFTASMNTRSNISFSTRNNVEGISLFDLHAIANARAGEITFGSANHFVARIDGDDATVVRHAAQKVNHGIANRHPAFQYLFGLDCSGSDFEEQRDFAIRNWHAMVRCIVFHLREQIVTRRQQPIKYSACSR